MELAEKNGKKWGLVDQVPNKKPWDCKQIRSIYQDFGNFNYGMTGSAAGIPENILLRGAGWAQSRAGTSKPEFGKWWDINGGYGDDPNDQEQIKRGIQYFKCGCYKGN